MEIKHLEWLQIEVDNIKLYGYNQGWYNTSFKRTRGCGPTAATMLLNYMNIRERYPLPFRNHNVIEIRKTLEEIWDFITPGWLLGLNSTGKLCNGMAALLEHYGLNWRCHALKITVYQYKRVNLKQVVAFLEAGIASDCPIAFLNLHKGQVTSLDSWHWIVLVALRYDITHNRYMATCYDGGRQIVFDVGLWLETTRLGGGFVYVTA